MKIQGDKKKRGGKWPFGSVLENLGHFFGIFLLSAFFGHFDNSLVIFLPFFCLANLKKKQLSAVLQPCKLISIFGNL